MHLAQPARLDGHPRCRDRFGNQEVCAVGNSDRPAPGLVGWRHVGKPEHVGMRRLARRRCDLGLDRRKRRRSRELCLPRLT